MVDGEGQAIFTPTLDPGEHQAYAVCVGDRDNRTRSGTVVWVVEVAP